MSPFPTWLIGRRSSFASAYARSRIPIRSSQIKSRAPGCNRTDLELGQGRSAKLYEISRQFILRRTVDVISKYLPPKRASRPTSATHLRIRGLT